MRRKAARIAAVPGTNAFKIAMERMVLEPTAALPYVISGRIPKAVDLAAYAKAVDHAITGGGKAGRYSRELRRAFLWGPCSDLAAAVAVKAAAALARWRKKAGARGSTAACNGVCRPLRALSLILAKWGWEVVRPLEWRTSEGGKFAADDGDLGVRCGLHEIRESWRKCCFCQRFFSGLITRI